jgi:hypothetical protein
VIVPVIAGCSSHLYEYEPAAANAWEYSPLGHEVDGAPLRYSSQPNAAPADAMQTLCGYGVPFDHVTESPTWIVIAAGFQPVRSTAETDVLEADARKPARPMQRRFRRRAEPQLA